jgi:hypothetical protein
MVRGSDQESVMGSIPIRQFQFKARKRLEGASFLLAIE